MLRDASVARFLTSVLVLMLCRHGAVKLGSRRSTKDRVLDKDLDAYKRMRQNGVQPKNIDGSAQVEKRAEEKWQVETGIVPNT